MQEERKH